MFLAYLLSVLKISIDQTTFQVSTFATRHGETENTRGYGIMLAVCIYGFIYVILLIHLIIVDVRCSPYLSQAGPRLILISPLYIQKQINALKYKHLLGIK